MTVQQSLRLVMNGILNFPFDVGVTALVRETMKRNHAYPYFGRRKLTGSLRLWSLMINLY